jgi:hypothetical protein
MNPSKPAACIGALFVLAIASAPAASQDVRLGAQLGINLSTYAGEGIDGLDERRSGVVAGVTVDYGVARTLRLETGGVWIQKGAAGTVQGFEEAIPTRIRVSYLQVPALVRWTPLPVAPLRPSVALGPALSFETGCDYRSDPSDIAVLVGCEDEERPKIDVGVILGAALGFDVGRTAIMLEGRYDRGFRDLDAIDDVETKNSGFTLATRFTVPLGR